MYTYFMATNTTISKKNFSQNLLLHIFRRRRRFRLKGIHSRSDTNRTGAEGLSFYYPRLLHCLNQMLTWSYKASIEFLKTVIPCAPCGARYIGHAVSTWSAVCSEAPHSQFGEGARPHLCMAQAVEVNPSCSRQAHPNRPGTGPGHKSTEPGSTFTVLHFPFVVFPFRSTDAKSSKVVQKIPRS